jgi:GNAT superfamily N-acetyltransferase
VNDEILIRPADSNDTPEILKLLGASLGKTGSIPRNAAYWHWKHESSPFGPSAALVAEAEGHIVGLRIFMHWCWTAGGQNVPAVRAVDTATHPDWQGRGIFTRLTLNLVKRMRAEGTSFVFNTPNERSRPGYIKMGWVSLGRVSLLILPLRPWAMLSALVDHAHRDNRPMASDAERDRAELTFAGESVQEFLREPDIERFLEDVTLVDSRLCTAVTKTYLRWRYLEIPEFEYRVDWVRKGSEGAVVFSRLRPRGRLLELRVCQVMLGRSRASTLLARDLLRKIARNTGVDYAVALGAPRSPERRALIRAGFLPAPRLGPTLTVRRLSPSPVRPDPTRRVDWRLSIGDLELF